MKRIEVSLQFTFRDLEVFLAVMMSGSATRAGQAVGMTQPNVSKIIKQMEHRIGVPLFMRVRGRLQATPEAEKLFIQARHLQEEINTFAKYATRIKNESTGILRICALPLFSMRLIPDTIALFAQEYPNVEIHIETSHDKRILEAVSRGHADLGLVHSTQADNSENTKTHIIGHSPMMCAVHRDNALASRGIIKPTDLVGQRIISYPEFLPFRKSIEQLFDLEGVEFEPNIIVNHANLAFELVARNIGIAVLDALTISIYNQDVRLIRLENGPQIEVGLLLQPTRPLSQLAQKFRIMLEASLQQCQIV